MTRRFDDKVMVVTGAAQGIGRCVAERAASEGARVLIVDRSPARKDVVKAIRQAGGEADAISVNLETWSGCEKALQKAMDLWGRIDILINNVGGTIWAKPFEQYEAKQIDAEVRRSLFPTLYCCRAAIEHMLPQGAGVIEQAVAGVGRFGSGAAAGEELAPERGFKCCYAAGYC